MRPPKYRDDRPQFAFWFTLFTTFSLAILFGISLVALATSLKNQNQPCFGGCVNGSTASIAIGKTTTSPCTELATVTNSGNTTNAIFNFSIPEGCPGQNANVTVTILNLSNNTNVTEIIYNVSNFNVYINITENTSFISTPGPPGPPGQPGTNGINGVNPSITVGSTTTTLAGTDATVTNDGNATDLVLNFTIPKGETGSPGHNANVTITIQLITNDFHMDHG